MLYTCMKLHCHLKALVGHLLFYSEKKVIPPVILVLLQKLRCLHGYVMQLDEMLVIT